MQDDKPNPELDATEEFIREYCARTELETKARDAALLLYKKLKECENITEAEDKKKEEEPSKEEKSEDKSEEKSVEETEEPAISDEKLKKLQNKRQGKKSYKEYLKGQLQTIGMAGIIAMSTAVYSQGQVVYKNGMIVFEVLEKEFPFLTTIKNLITGPEGSNTSQNNSNSGSSNDASNNAAAISNSSADNTASNDSSPAFTTTDNPKQTTQSSDDTSQQTASTQQTIKEGNRDGDNNFSKDENNLQIDFGKPIVPPKTTETNPQ